MAQHACVAAACSCVVPQQACAVAEQSCVEHCVWNLLGLTIMSGSGALAAEQSCVVREASVAVQQSRVAAERSDVVVGPQW